MSIADAMDAVTKWRKRQTQCQLNQDYFDGNHELKFASQKFRETYARELGGSGLDLRENLCPAAVFAFTDGLEVTSWGGDKDDEAADEHGLSRLEAFVNKEGFRQGDAFVLAWPDARGVNRASFQKASAMVPKVDELNPAVMAWCAKVWIGASRIGYVNVYYPDRLLRWETREPVATDGGVVNAQSLPTEASSWQERSDDKGHDIPHDFGAVPVCWFKLDADDPFDHGTSILNDVIPLQDALNKSLADLVVNSEAYARPFWYLLNHKPSAAPAALNPYVTQAQSAPLSEQAVGGITPLVRHPEGVMQSVLGTEPRSRRFDRNRQDIFTTDGPGGFGQLDPPDLTRLLKVQDGYAMKLARVIGVPSYYFTQTSGDVPSGESLRVLSGRRTARIKSWQRDAKPVWRGLKQLLGMSDEPVVYADPLPLDETERMQVALDKKGLGYSLEDIARDLGEADVEGIVARAQASRRDLGQAFSDGAATFEV